MKLIIIFSLILIIIGFFEKKNHMNKIKNIPIRIYINGIRGKSSTTRLIAAALREAGYSVLAKTTGTEAKFIMNDGSEEKITRWGIARIKEQMKACHLAHKQKVDALVMECMAISPEMQWTSEHQMLKSTIGVITNVRYDHIDIMGSNLTDIAKTLALTIPLNGKLVIGPGKVNKVFYKVASENKTIISKYSPDLIDNEELHSFKYPVFKENIACTLKVCSLLKIDRDTALKGMKKAKPDEGALKIIFINYDGKKIYLINAFAANDYSSTIKVWEKCKNWYSEDIFDNLSLIGLFNHRSDRGFRAKEIPELVKNIEIEVLHITGLQTTLQNKIDSIKTFSYPFAFSIKKLIKKINNSQESNKDFLIFGFGNINGTGKKILNYFQKYGEVL